MGATGLLRVVDSVSDEAALVLLEAGSRDPDVVRWTPILPELDRDGAAQRLTKLVEHGGLWLVVHAAEPVGTVCAFPARSGSGATELGYWLLAKARGRALMSRAVTEVLAISAATRVELAIAPANAASQRVARAAGFHLTGASQQHQGVTLSLWAWQRVAGQPPTPVSAPRTV